MPLPKKSTIFSTAQVNLLYYSCATTQNPVLIPQLFSIAGSQSINRRKRGDIEKIIDPVSLKSSFESKTYRRIFNHAQANDVTHTVFPAFDGAGGSRCRSG
jgi:hypothetical protein